MKFKEYLEEKIGWENLPKGWTKDSVKKFAKSLTGKGATKEDFFEACVVEMRNKMDDPEAFCASVKDQVWGTTYWRSKGKKK